MFCRIDLYSEIILKIIIDTDEELLRKYIRKFVFHNSLPMAFVGAAQRQYSVEYIVTR